MHDPCDLSTVRVIAYFEDALDAVLRVCLGRCHGDVVRHRVVIEIDVQRVCGLQRHAVGIKEAGPRIRPRPRNERRWLGGYVGHRRRDGWRGAYGRRANPSFSMLIPGDGLDEALRRMDMEDRGSEGALRRGLSHGGTGARHGAELSPSCGKDVVGCDGREIGGVKGEGGDCAVRRARIERVAIRGPLHVHDMPLEQVARDQEGPGDACDPHRHGLVLRAEGDDRHWLLLGALEPLGTAGGYRHGMLVSHEGEVRGPRVPLDNARHKHGAIHRIRREQEFAVRCPRQAVEKGAAGTAAKWV